MAVTLRSPPHVTIRESPRRVKPPGSRSPSIVTRDVQPATAWPLKRCDILDRYTMRCTVTARRHLGYGRSYVDRATHLPTHVRPRAGPLNRKRPEREPRPLPAICDAGLRPAWAELLGRSLARGGRRRLGRCRRWGHPRRHRRRRRRRRRARRTARRFFFMVSRCLLGLLVGARRERRWMIGPARCLLPRPGSVRRLEPRSVAPTRKGHAHGKRNVEYHTPGVPNARRLERPGRVRTATPMRWSWNTRCGALEDGPPPLRREGSFHSDAISRDQTPVSRMARSSPGDRHISNDRTQPLRCALGKSHGRDLRFECPTPQSRPRALAPHRSPA